MRKHGWGTYGSLSRFALVGLLGGLAGACSDSTRIAQTPFSNPFATASAPSEPTGEPVETGSLGQSERVTAAPLGSIESRPLAQPAPRNVTSIPAAPPAAAPARSVAAAPAPVSRSSGPGGWRAEGGSIVTVGQGETLNDISTRYGVPSSAILQANNLTSASQVTAGRRVTIPVYSVTAAPARASEPGPRQVQAAAPSAPASRARPGQPYIAPAPPVAQKAAPAQVAEAKIPVRSETKQAPKAEVQSEPQSGTRAKPRVIELPKKPESPTKTSQQPAKPEPKVAEAKAAAPKATALAVGPIPAQPAQAAPEAAKPQKVASLGAPPISKPVEAPKPEESKASVAAAPPAPQPLGFRWPARGRVISGFGSAGNEGINIALPEGTPVKAAEEGTVAYAGGDVKGYGKLVLIRHENGHVSAYAHNGEIAVKAGDKVRRGQVVAKSGATGNVTSPQLHFEIRKGSTPVDPMPHLTGG